MRGIAGTIAPDLASDAQQSVARMLAASLSDYTSVTLLPNAALGPDAHFTADRSVALVWDGSLANARELRTALAGAGFRIHSPDPAELLLTGWRAWGARGLAERLRGAFALAFFETGPRRLTLIRDRLGLRRLAYVAQPRQVSFCTSVRGLRLSWPGAGLARDLDPAGVARFLDSGWVPDDHTIYHDVRKVPAGTIVEISASGVQTDAYWRMPRPERQARFDFETSAAIAERLLLEAVQARLESPSPVAALLGVGIESSLLGWALAQLQARIPIYRVASADEDAHETAAAQDLMRRLGLRQEVLWIAANEEPRVAEVAEAYDEPYAAPGAFQMLRVGRAVRRQAGVVLTGDGVEWPFLGSPLHLRCWQMQRLLGDLDIADLPVTAGLRDLLGLPSAYLRPGALAGRFFGPRLRAWRAEQAQPPEPSGSASRLLADFLAYDRSATFDRDRAGMAGAAQFFGVEVRSPFLDDALWDFVTRLPYDLRLQGGRSRAILRELARFRVSGSLAGRQKAHPSAQVRHLLATRWHPALEEVLNDSYLVGEGWIDAAAIWGEFEAVGRRKQASRTLWHFFILEYWLRRAATQPLRTGRAAVAVASGD